MVLNIIDGELPRKPKDVKPSSIHESAHEKLKQVERKYEAFEVSAECRLVDFVKCIEVLNAFEPKLGYGFYQFTEKEMISYNDQVLLRDKV